MSFPHALLAMVKLSPSPSCLLALPCACPKFLLATTSVTVAGSLTHEYASSYTMDDRLRWDSSGWVGRWWDACMCCSSSLSVFVTLFLFCSSHHAPFIILILFCCYYIPLLLTSLSSVVSSLVYHFLALTFFDNFISAIMFAIITLQLVYGYELLCVCPMGSKKCMSGNLCKSELTKHFTQILCPVLQQHPTQFQLVSYWMSRSSKAGYKTNTQ